MAGARYSGDEVNGLLGSLEMRMISQDERPNKLLSDTEYRVPGDSKNAEAQIRQTDRCCLPHKIGQERFGELSLLFIENMEGRDSWDRKQKCTLFYLQLAAATREKYLIVRDDDAMLSFSQEPKNINCYTPIISVPDRIVIPKSVLKRNIRFCMHLLITFHDIWYLI